VRQDQYGGQALDRLERQGPLLLNLLAAAVTAGQQLGVAILRHLQPSL
jgi:hypothetical protein